MSAALEKEVLTPEEWRAPLRRQISDIVRPWDWVTPVLIGAVIAASTALPTVIARMVGWQ